MHSARSRDITRIRAIFCTDFCVLPTVLTQSLLSASQVLPLLRSTMGHDHGVLRGLKQSISQVSYASRTAPLPNSMLRAQAQARIKVPFECASMQPVTLRDTTLIRALSTMGSCAPRVVPSLWGRARDSTRALSLWDQHWWRGHRHLCRFE